MRSSALVFAPHPDDEVLGCGGTIVLKALAGARVTVVIMTDGRTSHSQFIDPVTLVQMRCLEALEASQRLGLRPSDYVFLEFEDGRLAQQSAAAQRAVAELLSRHDPAQVFVPHRHDRLRDHVATYEIVTSALRERGGPVTVFEYPVWLWNIWPWTSTLSRGRSELLGIPRLLRDGIELAFGCRTRVDIRSVMQEKIDALAQYRSQVRRHGDDPGWPILADVADGTFLERFRAGLEVFRRTSW